MEDFLNIIIPYLTSLGLKLIEAAVVLIVGLKLVKVFIGFLRGRQHLQKIDKSVASFLISFANIALKIIVVVSVAAILGVDTTSMIAIAGSVGLAIGLAFQGSLSNLAGGMMIIIFKPFKVGDFIDDGSYSGTVRSIGVFYTEILTADNRAAVIPNSILSNEKLINVSKEKMRRIDITFSCAYASDIDKVNSILLEEAFRNEKVIKDVEKLQPFAHLWEQGDSALVFMLRVWCQAADYWDVKVDITESVKKRFDAEKIEIPFPQMDVHIIK